MNTVKQIAGVSILLGLLAGMGTAQAATLDWDGGDGAWETASNWKTNGVVVESIPIAGDGVNVVTYVGTARVSTVTGRVPASGDLGAISIKGAGRAVIQTGGEVYSSAAMVLGAAGGGTYELQDGTFTLANTLDMTPANDSQIGYFIQSGGTATVSSVRMNYKGTGTADIEIGGGEFTVNGNLQMAYVPGPGVASYFTQTGGVAKVTGQLRLGNSTAQSAPNAAVVNLDGGELTIQGATPLFFADPLDDFIRYGEGENDTYPRPDENWKGDRYWRVADIGGGDDVAICNVDNKLFGQIWSNTVTDASGQVTLEFDLFKNGDDDIGVLVVGWYTNGPNPDLSYNSMRDIDFQIRVGTDFDLDLLLGHNKEYVVNAVGSYGHAGTSPYYYACTDGDGAVSITLDPAVDLSKYQYIGIGFRDANAGAWVDNVKLTTATGGDSIPKGFDFNPDDMGVLTPGGPHCVDFDGGALYIKASSGITNFTTLTAIPNSDFRSFGEPAAVNTLKFTTENIGGTDYTKIIAIVPPPAGTVISIR